MVEALVDRLLLNSPSEKILPDGRKYRAYGVDVMQMITLADGLKKAHASISDMDNRTVILTEYNRRGIWRFKYYAIDESHAETVLEDILVTQRKIDERQMIFDF